MAACAWLNMRFADRTVGLYVPDAGSVKAAYEKKLQQETEVLFPYWAHLWPASRAICEMLAESPWMVEGKRVLEIAAGLGLPSLFVAEMAASVCCSDRSAEAMALAQASVERNHIRNVQTMVIDWRHLPSELPYDLVLLSDVNYDPDDLDDLRVLFDRLLKAGVSIILSTPERIVAADLLNDLLPFVRLRRQYEPEPGRNIHVLCLAQSEEGFTSNR